MNHTSRPALLFASCATLAISQVHACGIELDTAPDTDAGSGSSSSGRTSSGTPMASSSSGGSSTSSSGGSSSGSTSSSSGSPEPDASTCNPIALAQASFACPAAAGTATFPVDDETVTCARLGAGAGGPSILAPDAVGEAGAVWVQRGLTRSDGYVVEAQVSLQGNVANLGTGFTVAFVRANADAGDAPPGVGRASGGMGVGSLADYAGVAAAAQTFSGLHFRPTAVPTLTGDVDGWLTADPFTVIAPPAIYRLVARHEPDASTITVDLFTDPEMAPTASVVLDLTGSAVADRIDYLGVTASTGGSTRGRYEILSLSLSCLP